ESPFAPGERVCFEGEVSWISDGTVQSSGAEPPVSALDALRDSFCWTTSFGAGRTVGFGRVAGIVVAGETVESETAGTNRPIETVQAVPPRAGLTIRMLDPFCVSKRRISDNIFESDTVLSGAVIRGYLATTINQAIGSSEGADVSDLTCTPSLWPALRAVFHRIRITHAFPSKASRPTVPPLSLVKANQEVYDVALCDGPTLIDGSAPEFRIDWKSSAGVDADYQWPKLQRQLRVRTAIDRERHRSKDEQLFAYEMVIPPEDVAWRATIDLSEVPENDRVAVVADLESVLAIRRPGIGKSKARAEITLSTVDPYGEARKIAGKGEWIVTLQTPALLCDPLELGPSAGRKELGEEYARVFLALDSNMRLVRYFATQSLAGGYLTRRFQAGKEYYPFLLTDAGSVFVFDTEEGKPAQSVVQVLEGWRDRGLPLPAWAEDRYENDWRSNPFLPADGFGEIAIGPSPYRTPAEAPLFKLDPPLVAATKCPTLRSRKLTPSDEATAPSSKAAARWKIEGTLTTRSPLHLGDGGFTHHPGLDEHEAESGIEIASVATTPRTPASEGYLPYIPGSSIKGALRARLAERGVSDTELEAIFGRRSKSGDSGSGGLAEFHDAIATLPESCDALGKNVAWWRPERLAGVATSVAINRQTRTAEERKLFHREFVPASVTFPITVTGEGLELDQINLLAGAFESETDPFILGKESRSGWGRMEWKLGEVTCVEPANRFEWLKAARSGIDSVAEVISITSRVGHVVNAAEFEIEIQFDGPYLVNDPSKSEVKKKKERRLADDQKRLPNHTSLVDSGGKPVLPGSSLRGALRSQAERIVRTLGGHACSPSSPCKPLQKLNLDSLCPVCLLFGATGWASLVHFSPFDLQNDPKPPLHQDFVAIDRFTGGGADGAKFDAVGFWQPHFKGRLAISGRLADAELRDSALGLLALTLRDLAEGDIPIGFGSAKGYGWCTATWSSGSIDSSQRERMVAAFRKRLGLAVAAPQPDAPAEVSRVHATYPARSTAGKPRSQDENDFHNPYVFVPTP
ncbi:MAG TPA: RAMP superfamily CRISPR-associated protein, partial [Gemmataceae bacterium]|nr:RAMP superfamily CRISPR-associated protein [Gemmataceae bacterium]